MATNNSKQEQRVNQLIDSLADKWAIVSPHKPMTRAMKQMITEHLTYAYGVGHDDLQKDIVEVINRTFVIEQSVNYSLLIGLINKL